MPVETRLIEAMEKGELPDDLLICGPAGTGKTFSILTVLHILAADHPNLRILICRETRSSLTESVCVTYEQEILPADGMASLSHGVQRRVRQSYRYPNGSEIVLGGLDIQTRILSTSWDIIYVNEAIETREESWEMLGGRLNRPDRNPDFGYLIGDTNPGGPGHWLKERCDKGLTTLWDTTHEANPSLHDGIGWTDAGELYRARLDKLTGTRRLRLRDGVWAVGDGLWFDSFDPEKHVSEDADFDPALPVHLAVDSGVFTGGVWFQVRDVAGEDGHSRHVNVFGDYLSENLNAEANALAINRITNTLAPICTRLIGTTDPAGGARNPVGPKVIETYKANGLILRPWPVGSVSDGLERIEALLNPIGGQPRLTIHPRCKQTISAFQSYKRAKRANQWMDYPEDPQHPAEDVMDSLRGGLGAALSGRRVHVYTGTEDN